MNPRSTILPCPNCRQRLRVPTDRGGLILTCPTCRTRWDWSPTQEGGPGRQAPDASPPVTAAQAERTDADDRVGLDPRKLSDFMVREAVITDLQATTKEGAIREIVCSLKDAGYLAEADTESIIRAILAREELGSTGIGGGMACPETRHPAVNRVIGTIGRSRQGIEFDACDGEPVDLLFLVITPMLNRPGDHHRAMESIVRLTREPVVSLLRQAQTREEVGDLLVEADRMASVFPLLEAEQRNEFPRLEADQMIAVFPSENEMGHSPYGPWWPSPCVVRGASSRCSRSRTTIPRNRSTSRRWSERAELPRRSRGVFPKPIATPPGPPREPPGPPR